MRISSLLTSNSSILRPLNSAVIDFKANSAIDSSKFSDSLVIFAPTRLSKSINYATQNILDFTQNFIKNAIKIISPNQRSIENGDFQAKNDIAIESNAYNAPDDYKFHCFGKAHSKHIYIQVDTERFTNHSRTIFDLKWQKMDFEICFPMPSYVPQQPKNFALMLQIAKALSEDLNVRVDLYNPCVCVIVGELTFTHGGGTEKFNPPKWDKRFGEMWE